MVFRIAHELTDLQQPGDGRLRVRAGAAVPTALMQDICERLGGIEGVVCASASPRIGSLLILYDSREARTAALRILVASEGVPAQPSSAVAVQNGEASALGGFLPLLRYVLVRPFLPPLCRIPGADCQKQGMCQTLAGTAF